MSITNAVINLDTSQGIVYKNTNYPLSFAIIRGSENGTKNYAMTDDGVLGVGELYSQSIDRNLWDSIDSISTVDGGNQQSLNVTGVYKLGYKYKVTVQESGDVIQDYAADFYRTNSNEIIVNIPFSEITTALNPYHLVVTVLQEDNSTITATKPILLSDNAPTAVASIQGATLYAQLGDIDSGDTIKYNIYLNGEKIFPTGVEEYTALISPTTISYELPRNKITVGQLNHVQVNVVDNWGMSSQGTNDFVGVYVGLMFCDETEQYYSTDIGVILKQLDMGVLQAGKLSNIQTVWVKNTYSYDITNIVVTVNNATVPPLNIVYLDTSDTTFVGSNSITITNTLSYNQKVPFYLRIKPDIESIGGGVFEISATATPVV